MVYHYILKLTEYLRVCKSDRIRNIRRCMVDLISVENRKNKIFCYKISLSLQQSPPIPSNNSGHNNAFLKHDHRQMSHLQTTLFDNCTNQLNVSYYTLFLCTHTINYLNCRNYKIGKSDQYNG